MPEKLPMHHIDTSVIVESEKTIDGRFCRKYLQRVGYNYHGKFALPVLGELLMTTILFRGNDKRHTFLDIDKIASRIREIDTRLEPTDINIIACAIENVAIEREFGLRIMHPKDLL